MNISIIGLPGSGKGTQSKKLCAYLKIPHISVGDLLRSEIKNGTEFGIQIKELVNNGQIIPFSFNELLIKRLSQLDTQNGFVLDGFPRKLEQFQELEDSGFKISKIIALEVPEWVVFERLAKRARAENRADDTNITISRRIVEFHDNVVDIETTLHDRIIKLNANLNIESVFNKIKDAL